MSGTEAGHGRGSPGPLQHETPIFIVCFGGAYHGWWDGVQPGLGSERDIGDCLTLKELSEQSIRVIRQRGPKFAGVLVNPIQALHPNAPPPSDAVLMTSENTCDGRATVRTLTACG